jgi:hypothetical protein
MSPYMMREGRRIEIGYLDAGPILKKRRKPFQPEWAKLSRRWIEALRQSKRISTHQLAMIILLEAFKREQIGGEIVLSLAVTGMQRITRMRATKELVELGLIQTERKGRGKQALRVSHVYY